MLIRHEKSRFTQRLGDIFKWSKEKISSSSKNQIDSILDAEYAALLQEIDCLTNKNKCCTVSFKNENFSKPAVSSDEVSTLLKNHSSDVIQKYVRDHDKTKKYQNLTPTEFLSYLTEIIVTKCDDNKCNCGRHKIIVNQDDTRGKTREVPKQTERQEQINKDLQNDLKSISDRDKYIPEQGGSKQNDAGRACIYDTEKDKLEKLQEYKKSIDEYRNGIKETKNTFNNRRSSDKDRLSFNTNMTDAFDQGPTSNREGLNEYKQNLIESDDKKACSHKLCTCKPFIATKEIGTERVKLSISENVQADDGSVRLSKDKSAIFKENAIVETDVRLKMPSIQQAIIGTKPEEKTKVENEGIQTSDCVIQPDCYCCKKYATTDKNINGKINESKVVTKDQDTKMTPDSAAQTSRLCVPKNYNQLMQDPKRIYEFFNCPLEKKDCMCDAYDAKLAIERGWILPNSEMCMQKGKKPENSKTTKSDTDVTSVSSIEPSTKGHRTQFKPKKKPQLDTAQSTESEMSSESYVVDNKTVSANKSEEKLKKKNKQDKSSKQQKVKKEETKKNQKEKKKGSPKKKEENKKEKKEKIKKKDESSDEEIVKSIKYPTCASDTSLSSVLEERKSKRQTLKQVKYDNTDSKNAMEKGNLQKETKKSKKEAKKNKKENVTCGENEEVTGCFCKKKKRTNCDEACDAECNRAIQTKPALIANKKDQANVVVDSAQPKTNKKDSVVSMQADVSSKKAKGTGKSGSAVMCGKCGKDKSGCCHGCRNTIVVQPASSRNLSDSNSLRLLIKMQAKDTNRRFDDIMTELKCQKSEIERLNNVYQCIICCENTRMPNNDILKNNRNVSDLNDNRKNSNGRKHSGAYGEERRYGPEGTTVAINRCEVCHFNIAKEQFSKYVKETSSKETSNSSISGNFESEKFKKDMINQSRQHLQREPFFSSNEHFCRPRCNTNLTDDHFGSQKKSSDIIRYNRDDEENKVEKERFRHPQRHYQMRKQTTEKIIQPKTRIPFGETSIAGSREKEDENKFVQENLDENVAGHDERKNAEILQEKENLKVGNQSKKTQTDIEKNETEEIKLDSESEPNDSCKDRFYAWLKSSWTKVEDCQKKHREMNKEKAAARRSTIKTGLVKIIRSLIQTKNKNTTNP